MPASAQLIEDLLADWAFTKAERQNLENLWEDLAELYYPAQRGFTSRHPMGDDDLEEVYDGEQIERAVELANSIESMLVPKAERWVEIGTSFEDEAEDDSAKEWLDEAGKILLEQMYYAAAGFQRATSISFRQLVVFGAGPVWVGETTDLKNLLFQTTHLRNSHWRTTEGGLPETFFRHRMLRPLECARKWGLEALSRELQAKCRSEVAATRNTPVSILDITTPRWQREIGSPLSTQMPYASYIVEVATRHLVQEGGYLEMPWVVPIWELMEEDDLWSPGRRGLPDVRQLQQMGRTMLRAGQKTVDPPILIAGDGILGNLRLYAGGVTQFDASAIPAKLGRQGIIERIDIGGNLPIGLEMQQDQRSRVGDIFLRSVLRLPDKSGMTATEILRLNADLVRLTDSPFGLLETSFSQPLVERCFNILIRKSETARFNQDAGAPFKTPPESLQGKDVVFKLRSPVARARKAQDTAQLSVVLEALGPLVQLRPAVIDNLDEDQLFREVITAGLAPKFLRPYDDVVAMRQAQAEAAAQAEKMQQAAMIAKAAGDAAPAVKAIGDLTDQGGGQKLLPAPQQQAA